MLTQRQARRALRHTNQIIGALARVNGTRWGFAQWFTQRGAWVFVTHPDTHRKVQSLRKLARLYQAAHDLGLNTWALEREMQAGGRAEAILSRAAKADLADRAVIMGIAA